MSVNTNPLIQILVEAAAFDAAGRDEEEATYAAILHAAVHGWMEGHVAAPGHELSVGAEDEPMPAPPFPGRHDPQLPEIVERVRSDFAHDELPAAVTAAAAYGWRAGRREGEQCPGCEMATADNELAAAIRAGRVEWRLSAR